MSWQGRQIVHTKKGTKIRKNEGIWNNESFTAEKITESLFLEDIGTGDLTSQSIFGEQSCEAEIVAKSEGIFAGAAIIKEGFSLLDENVQIILHKKDGDMLHKGEVIAELHGPAAALLSGERVVLNLIQRLSGIATMTREAVRCLDDEQIKICDTRKTTPYQNAGEICCQSRRRV